jgi:hypothetical protein
LPNFSRQAENFGQKTIRATYCVFLGTLFEEPHAFENGAKRDSFGGK